MKKTLLVLSTIFSFSLTGWAGFLTDDIASVDPVLARAGMRESDTTQQIRTSYLNLQKKEPFRQQKSCREIIFLAALLDSAVEGHQKALNLYNRIVDDYLQHKNRGEESELFKVLGARWGGAATGVDQRVYTFGAALKAATQPAARLYQECKPTQSIQKCYDSDQHCKPIVQLWWKAHIQGHAYVQNQTLAQLFVLHLRTASTDRTRDPYVFVKAHAQIYKKLRRFEGFTSDDERIFLTHVAQSDSAWRGTYLPYYEVVSSENADYQNFLDGIYGPLCKLASDKNADLMGQLDGAYNPYQGWVTECIKSEISEEDDQEVLELFKQLEASDDEINRMEEFFRKYRDLFYKMDAQSNSLWKKYNSFLQGETGEMRKRKILEITGRPNAPILFTVRKIKGSSPFAPKEKIRKIKNPESKEFVEVVWAKPEEARDLLENPYYGCLGWKTRNSLRGTNFSTQTDIDTSDLLLNQIDFGKGQTSEEKIKKVRNFIRKYIARFCGFDANGDKRYTSHTYLGVTAPIWDPFAFSRDIERHRSLFWEVISTAEE